MAATSRKKKTKVTSRAAHMRHVDDRSFHVPWSSIYVPERQIRTGELPRIPQLARSLATKGQIHPVIVTAGGPKGYAYTLDEGYRRMAAFAHNGWQNRTILVRLSIIGDALDRVVTNWHANNERAEITHLDRAQCIASLLDGTYPSIGAEKTPSLSVDEVAEHLSLTKSAVQRLYRVHKDLAVDVRLLAHAVRAPLRVLVHASRVAASRSDLSHADVIALQTEIITKWKDEKDRLAASGRVRKERADKGQSSKAARSSALVADARRLEHASYRTADGEAYRVADLVRVIEEKRRALTKATFHRTRMTVRERAARLDGILELASFMRGEKNHLADLSLRDFQIAFASEAT